MAFLNDSVYDNGLSWAQTNGTRLDICSQEPTTYAEATATYSLGNATASIGAPADNAPDGRKVTVGAIAGGSVTATGTATHWVVTDGAGVVVSSGPLSSSQAVTSGNTFDLAAFDLAIRDAA